MSSLPELITSSAVRPRLSARETLEHGDVLELECFSRHIRPLIWNASLEDGLHAAKVYRMERPPASLENVLLNAMSSD
jgi:hypothetical protein